MKSMRRALLVFVAALTVSACQVDTSVEVKVEADGSGTITVNATADADVVAQAPGLAEDLRFDDAVAAGWTLQGPSATDAGGLSVTLTHDFATVEEATSLLASVNGSGGPLHDVAVTRTVTDDEITTSLEGTLRIDGTRLVGEVNCARRRRRIEKEIAKCLGSAATLADTTVTNLGEALKARRSAGSTGPAAGAAAGSAAGAERPPELQMVEAELAQRHWDAWIDTKIPALGHRTPRQAAKTARGRERLAALLADYAQKGVGGRNAFEPDIGALRQRLGLE